MSMLSGPNHLLRMIMIIMVGVGFVASEDFTQGPKIQSKSLRALCTRDLTHTQRGNATIKRTPQTTRIQKGHPKLSNLKKDEETEE